MNKDTTFNKSNKNNQKNFMLKIIDGPDKGKQFKIYVANYFQSIILGRNTFDSEASFKLKNIDRCISRNHCIFEVPAYSDSVYLIDNNSLNGTWIYRKRHTSFKRIKSKIKLEDNDIILIGHTSMIIKIDNDNDNNNDNHIDKQILL